MISIKSGGKEGTDAKVKGMQPEILLAIIIASELLWRMFEKDLTLTSVTDSHKPPSLHPLGYAFDMRTWGMSGTEKAKFGDELTDLLGAEYDVVVEEDHIHVEFDPKDVEFDPPSSTLTEVLDKEENQLVYLSKEEQEEDSLLAYIRGANMEKKLDKILEWIKKQGEGR